MLQSEFFDAALNQADRKPFAKWRSVDQFKKCWQCQDAGGKSLCLCASAKRGGGIEEEECAVGHGLEEQHADASGAPKSVDGRGAGKESETTNPMQRHRGLVRKVSMRDTLDGDVTLAVELTSHGVAGDRVGASGITLEGDELDGLDDSSGGASDAHDETKPQSRSSPTIDKSTLRRESLAMAHLHAEAEAAVRREGAQLHDDKPKQIRVVLNKIRGYITLFLSRDAAESGAFAEHKSVVDDTCDTPNPLRCYLCTLADPLPFPYSLAPTLT